MRKSEPSPRHDAATEWSIVCDLADGRLQVDDVLEAGVSDASIYDPLAGPAWRWVVDALLAGRPVSGEHGRMDVGNALRDQRELRAAELRAAHGGDVPLSVELGDRPATLAMWRDLRDASRVADELRRNLEHVECDPDLAIARAIDQLSEIGIERGVELIGMDELFADRYEAYRVPARVTPTGTPDIDRLLGGGLRPGTMTVLAARPGVGKSAMALGVARAVAQTGKAALFVSLEMSAAQLGDRLIAAEAKVPVETLSRGDVGPRMLERVERARDAVTSLPLFIRTAGDDGITAVRRMAHRLARRRQLGLVVIDYLQLLLPEVGQNRTRNDEVAAISRGVKLLALELDVPVLALSQLNRAVEHRNGKRPGLADLRDSGSVEQDADVVAFLSRTDDGPVRFEIGKNRQGALGSTELVFLPDSLTFAGLAHGEAF